MDVENSQVHSGTVTQAALSEQHEDQMTQFCENRLKHCHYDVKFDDAILY